MAQASGTDGAGGVAGAGVIVDDRYGADVLAEMTGAGWWVARPIERPGAVPLAFEGGPNVGLTLRAWPREHVVKCLVAYHPDDDEDLRRVQEERLAELFSACAATRHELLVEVVPPSERAIAADTLARTLGAFYDRGVFPDWWKLPPPDADAWATINEVIETRDRHCRGVLLLGGNAPDDVLERGFAAARGQPLCKGFAVGRAIFAAAAEAWFAGAADDEAAIAMIAERYARVVALWDKQAGRAEGG
jgi:5-dehydro-2-deoxygluconokinase